MFLFYHKLYVVPHRGDSKEYTQHTIIIQKIEKNLLNYIHLPPDLALWLTLSGSNYLYLEQISMVQRDIPKGHSSPLRFDYSEREAMEKTVRQTGYSPKCFMLATGTSTCNRKNCAKLRGLVWEENISFWFNEMPE